MTEKTSRLPLRRALAAPVWLAVFAFAAPAWAQATPQDQAVA